MIALLLARKPDYRFCVGFTGRARVACFFPPVFSSQSSRSFSMPSLETRERKRDPCKSQIFDQRPGQVSLVWTLSKITYTHGE